MKKQAFIKAIVLLLWLPLIFLLNKLRIMIGDEPAMEIGEMHVNAVMLMFFLILYTSSYFSYNFKEITHSSIFKRDLMVYLCIIIIPIVINIILIFKTLSLGSQRIDGDLWLINYTTLKVLSIVCLALISFHLGFIISCLIKGKGFERWGIHPLTWVILFAGLGIGGIILILLIVSGKGRNFFLFNVIPYRTCKKCGYMVKGKKCVDIVTGETKGDIKRKVGTLENNYGGSVDIYLKEKGDILTATYYEWIEYNCLHCGNIWKSKKRETFSTSYAKEDLLNGK